MTSQAIFLFDLFCYLFLPLLLLDGPFNDVFYCVYSVYCSYSALLAIVLKLFSEYIAKEEEKNEFYAILLNILTL